MMFSAPNLPRTPRQFATVDPSLILEGSWTGLASRDLFRAIEDLDPETFKELTLQPRFKGRMNIHDGHGFGLMHNLAISNPEKIYEDDAMEIVEAFCQAGGDLNLLTSLGESALHMAAINSINEPVIMALVKNGADVLLKNRHQLTPIEIAEEAIMTDQHLLNSRDAAMLCLEEAEHIQQRGQSISSKADQCSEGNWTGLATGDLFRAIKDADPEIFKELTLQPQFKGKMNILDGIDHGLMHTLSLCGSIHEEDAMEIVETFCQAGGDLNLVTLLGDNALHLAARLVNEPVVIALVENGANVTLKNKCNQTPLEIAKSVVKEEPEEEEAHSIVHILEEEIEAQQSTEQAEAFRKLGNRYYVEDKFEKALDMYKKALNLVLDHRTYGNLSATYLKIATRNLFATGGGEGHIKDFESAFANAKHASQLDPTFLKHYFRQAKACIGFRDLPKAKEVCQEGMTISDSKKGADYEALKRLYESLVELGEDDVDEGFIMELTRF